MSFEREYAQIGPHPLHSPLLHGSSVFMSFLILLNDIIWNLTNMLNTSNQLMRVKISGIASIVIRFFDVGQSHILISFLHTKRGIDYSHFENE